MYWLFILLLVAGASAAPVNVNPTNVGAISATGVFVNQPRNPFPQTGVSALSHYLQHFAGHPWLCCTTLAEWP